MGDIQLEKFLDKDGNIDLMKLKKNKEKKFLLQTFKSLLIEDDISLNYYIFDVIRNSDNYLECRELYDAFIRNLGSFLKSINVKKSLKVAYFYNYLLDNGYLSINKNNIYKNYRSDTDSYNMEILGSRVISGVSVCRHNASMLTDLLNVMGYSACNVSVRGCDSLIYELIPSLLKLQPLYFDHLVTGIIDKDGKYLFDSTCEYNVATFQNKRAKKLGIAPNSIAFYLNDSGIGYRIDMKTDKDVENFNYRYEKEEERFKDADFKKISSSTLEDLYSFTCNKGKKRVKELEDFYMEHEEKLQRIAQLERKLFPCSNFGIRTWKIK